MILAKISRQMGGDHQLEYSSKFTGNAPTPLMVVVVVMPRPLGGGIKRWCCPTSVCLTSVCLSVAYIGPKSRTETPRIRKTKIGTEVAHVTRDSDTTFKVKRSKVKVTGAGHIVVASCLQLVVVVLLPLQFLLLYYYCCWQCYWQLSDY